MPQPTPTPTTPRPTPDPRLAAEHIYLIVAGITGTAALAVWLYDVNEPIHLGIFAVLRVLACAAGVGYLVRSAEARLARQLARKAVDVDEVKKEAFAQGWVACAAARGGEPPRLQSVN